MYKIAQKVNIQKRIVAQNCKNCTVCLNALINCYLATTQLSKSHKQMLSESEL